MFLSKKTKELLLEYYYYDKTIFYKCKNSFFVTRIEQDQGESVQLGKSHDFFFLIKIQNFGLKFSSSKNSELYMLVKFT